MHLVLQLLISPQQGLFMSAVQRGKKTRGQMAAASASTDAGSTMRGTIIKVNANLLQTCIMTTTSTCWCELSMHGFSMLNS